MGEWAGSSVVKSTGAMPSEWGSRNRVVGSALFAHYMPLGLTPCIAVEMLMVWLFTVLVQACRKVLASSDSTCERKPREQSRCSTGHCPRAATLVKPSRSSLPTTQAPEVTVPARMVPCRRSRRLLDHISLRRLDRWWLPCSLPQAE